MLSICALRLRGGSIQKPLNLLFKSCSETCQFLSEQKKAIVVPVFKKGDRQLLKNHRPISLLPITGKVFRRLLYSQMFEFFMRNDLILMLVSKAFDKMWHQGFLPKLKQNGISVNMLEALTDFFKRLRANICIEWTKLLVRKC